MSLSWRERIVAARARGYFTAEDSHHAASWATCAVGEQHAALPSVVVYGYVIPSDWVWRIGGPVPGDPLNQLGSEFFQAVRVNDMDAAEVALDAIEDRVLVMKREATS